MIYHFDENKKEDFLFHALCDVLGSASDKTAIEILDISDYHNTQELDVRMQINGVEVDVRSFWDHLEKEFYRMIKEKAGELVVDKLLEVTEFFDDVKSAVEQKLCDDFGITLERED